MRTAKDLFNEIRYIEQLLNTIKLMENCINSSNKLLCIKRGRNIGFIELDLGNKT